MIATAPANTARARVRVSLSGTAATTFWLDDGIFCESAVPVLPLRTDNVTGGVTGETAAFDSANILGGPMAGLVRQNRTIWHRIQTNGKTYPVFYGYTDTWGPTWDDSGIGEMTARMRATDGRKFFARSNFIHSLPDVVEYDELQQADDPFVLYNLDEQRGTKMVAHTKVIKYKKGPKKGKKKRIKKWRTRETRADLTGIAGPSGTYKNTPLLGEEGPIFGDDATCVRFRKAQNEYATFTIDSGELVDTEEITIEAWVNLDSLSSDMTIFSFPKTTKAGVDFIPGFVRIDAGGGVSWEIEDEFGADGVVFAGTTSVGTWYHVCATRADGGEMFVYLNGVEVGSSLGIVNATAVAGTCAIGRNQWIAGLGSAGAYFDGRIARLGIYEKFFTVDRALARYNAAFYGLEESLSGERLVNVLNTMGKFSLPYQIDPGTKTMVPARYAGLPPQELLDEVLFAETEPSLFFFSREGYPTFRDNDYREDVTTPEFTIGPTGVQYEGMNTSDTDTFYYNKVVGTREDEVTFIAEDLDLIEEDGEYVLQIDGIPLVSDADAQAYVDGLLARYASNTARITNFLLNGADTTQRDAILTLEFGDYVLCQLTPPGATVQWQQYSYIERRRLSQEEGSPIMGEFGVSPK